jgi:hypothetical protein
MKVLVLESDAGAADETVGALVGAGHHVSRCHEPGAAPFPCQGLDDHTRCPLDQDDTDVAVLVRRHPWPRPMPLEDGVRCALQRHIPLVVTGRLAGSPYQAWTTLEIDDPTQVVAAVEEAAHLPLARHSDAATAAMLEVLQRHEVDPSGALAEVHRDGGRLLVTLRIPLDTPDDAAEMAAVRATGAVRALDAYPGSIDATTERF